jgi:hypothetical protein
VFAQQGVVFDVLVIDSLSHDATRELAGRSPVRRRSLDQSGQKPGGVGDGEAQAVEVARRRHAGDRTRVAGRREDAASGLRSANPKLVARALPVDVDADDVGEAAGEPAR